jgi:hypothetical protein
MYTYLILLLRMAAFYCYFSGLAPHLAGAFLSGGDIMSAETTGAARESIQLTVAANALAAAIAEKLTADEQNIVGNLLTLVGTSLLSIAAIDESISTDEAASSGDSKAAAS